MFRHIFFYRLKVSVRDREMLFWTFLFPIVLATFFSMAFSNLSANETFNTIPVAVVDNAAYRQDQALQDVLAAASEGGLAGSSGQPLFALTVVDGSAAARALAEGSIAGYLVPGESLGVVVSGSGIRQTILKVFVDQYLQTRSAMETILQQDPAAMPALIARLDSQLSLIVDTPISSSAANSTLIYYFALLAMTCLYGGFWGLREVISIQPNLSAQAARLAVTPVHKMKLFGYSLLAALIVHMASIILLLVYLRLILGIDFGNKLGYVVLTAFTGSLMGVAIGGFIAAASRLSEGIKNAQLIGFSMIGSFLSGLMIADMKYIVMQSAPAVAWLNPANWVSNAFYALYYYDTVGHTLMNISLQLGLALILFGFVALVIRRQRYASL